MTDRSVRFIALGCAVDLLEGKDLLIVDTTKSRCSASHVTEKLLMMQKQKQYHV